MPAKLPYLASPGLAAKILSKIQEARRPDRFTQDFLETKLGQSGGNAMAMIPLLKRLGMLASDGTPTPLYDQFRNADTQASAMSRAIKAAYAELYDRNEYAHDLTKDKLVNLITEITGAAKDDATTRLIVSTFEGLKKFADFDASEPPQKADDKPPAEPDRSRSLVDDSIRKQASDDHVGFNVSYTINLNLPETTNPEVFNAIFRALRENLLKK